MLPVGPNWTIQKVKALVAQKFNLQADQHKLFDGPRELRGSRTLVAENRKAAMDGPAKKSSISISPNADVSTLRAEVQRAHGRIPEGSLNWNGKPLSDGRSLSSYGIAAHSRVAYTPRLNGG